MTLNAFGVHTYAGGLAAGVAEHFNLVGLGEHDGYGDGVKALNFPGVPLYPTYAEWPKQRGRGAKATQLIFGNPPCAPFSVASAGRVTRWHQDPRLQFWRDIVRLIPEAQPDILAFESVVPAWTNGRAFIDRLAATAAGWGYATTVLLHNAKHLGSVQDRARVFFVFHKIQAGWPTPPCFDRELTVRDVLKGVKVSAATRKRYETEAMLKPAHARLHQHFKGGGNLRQAFDEIYGVDAPRSQRGHVIGRPGFLSFKLHWDQPGRVFMGSGHILHPSEPRSLYPEEINAYGGFPKDWRWPNYSLGKISTFASQGVSPKCGAWLGAGAAASIERGKRLPRGPYYGVVDGRSKHAWEAGLQLVSTDPSGHAEPFSAQELAGALVEAKPPRPPRELSTPTGTRRPGSGAFIRELLVAGTPTEQILAQVHDRFPGSKATASDVAWNRGRLRKEGVTL